ncbi:MAG: GNAT family N-acetyltransferase [Betaproteobacteria bacterium]|nr:GNAT family N-acetyltransferase [Betaproteobacteria bacterium]MDH5220910.1 GNAT family N-acetyltransferase [Betaproteobacteria bacterium]MDH5350098.1 GNAT family N-acetyltransferase [Betaproteobacteria bacterium]
MAEYPLHLARRRTLADGRSVTIRPIRAEDEMPTRDFFDHLSEESRQMRFMKFVKALSDKMVHFFTHIDYQKHMAFVCEAEVEGRPTLVGEARYVANPDGRSCEFGVVIADDWHGSGIAGLLMEALIRAARAQRFDTMEGLVLRDNHDMLKFVRALGFEASADPVESTLMRAVKKL